MWEGPLCPDRKICRGTKAPPTLGFAELPDLFPRQFSAICFRENQTQIDLPAGFFQARRRDDSIAAVMSFPNEDNRASGRREKFLHGRGYSGAGAIHQSFDLDAAGERGLFRGPHHRRAHDRRVQSVLRTFLAALFLRLAALALPALAAAVGAGRFRRTFPAPAETFRRHPHEIAAERNAPQAGGKRSGWRRLSLDAARDLFRQFLPVIAGLRETAFGRVGQKSALDQDRRNGGAPQDIKTATPDPTIFGGRARKHIAMDALGQTSAVASVIISLDAIRAGARGAIEMHRDEGGAAIRVCD